METRKLKLALSAGAIALSMALAGCGGGGSSTAETPPAPPAPKAVSLAGVTAGYTTQAGSFVIEPGKMAISGDVAFMCAAGGDACTVMVDAMSMATYTGGMVTAGNSQTYQARLDAEEERNDLQKELNDRDEADAEATAKAMAAKLRKLAMAIGSVNEDDLDAHTQTITAKPSTAMDGDDPQSITGWVGASYSTGTSAMTTTTVVYNDQEAPASIAFNKKHMVIATGEANAGTVSILADASEATRKLIQMPNLPTNVNHKGVTVGPTNGIRGMFDGVPGLFTTPGSGDTGREVKVDAKGVPMWTGGALHFKPDSATATVMMADAAYMNLGWWLTETTAAGITDVTVAAWPSAGGSYTIGNMAALQGKATFEGIAVGKYTHKTINSIEGGHFNADAMLVAEFSDTTTEGMLTGTISGFMQDGQSIGDGWKVELAAAATNGTPDTFDPKSGATIVSAAVEDTNNGAMGTFGTQKTMGTWSAQFVDDSREDNMPGGVLGEFHVGAASHPINMVGAFAASNMEPDQPKK